MKRDIYDTKSYEKFLDYFNNFLTVKAFATHYNITRSSALRIINFFKSKEKESYDSECEEQLEKELSLIS